MTGKQDKETGRCARDEDRTWRKARARKGSFDEGARGEGREPARGAAQREKQEGVQETSEVGDTGASCNAQAMAIVLRKPS